MAVFFAVSPNATSDLTTAWLSTPILLTYVADDPASAILPQSGFLTDLELNIQDIAGGATAIQAALHYNLAETKALAGPTDSATFWIHPDTATLGSIGFTLANKSFKRPGTGSIGVYLNLRLNAGTAKLSALGARLHGYDASEMR